MFSSNFILKSASSLGPMIGRAAGVAAGYLVPYIGNKYLMEATRSFARDFRTKKDFPSIVQQVKRISGMKDIPHRIIDGIENAAFVPPNSLTEDQEKELEQSSKMKFRSGRDIEGKVLKSIVDSSRSQHGGLIIGKTMSNPYTVAHELGHAILENEGSVSGFLQRHASKANIVGNILTGAGIIPGAISIANMLSGEESPIADKLSRGLIYSGLAANLMGDVSRLVYENRANEIGRKLIEDSGIDITDEERKIGENMYSSAIGTYAMSPMKHLLPVIGYEAGKSLFGGI